MRDDLQLQSSLTPNTTHFGGLCDLSWPIRGQYFGQSKASHNQISNRKMSRRADRGKLRCIDKESFNQASLSIKTELHFTAYFVISTCVPESTRTLPRLRSGMWSRSQGDKDSFQRQSNNEETEMRSKCAQRLVQPALFCSSKY